MSLSGSLELNSRLADWVRFEGDTIIIHTGKVELGQGITTAIAMIAAEEMGVPMNRISVRTGNTARGPNEFMTTGSMSIEASGTAVRQACAEVKHHLVQLAAQQLGVDATQLELNQGSIRHPGSNTALTYFDLAPALDPEQHATGDIPTRPRGAYTLVGTSATRVDLAAKFTGGPAFLQDQRDGETVHARIVRPPGNAYRLARVEAKEIEAMAGVIRVVIDGSFIGVVATSEPAVIKAKARLAAAVTWRADPELALPRENYFDFLMANPGHSLAVINGTPNPDAVIPEPEQTTLNATYKKPFYMHGSIGPSAAMAHFDGEKLRLLSHSQGPFVIRDAIASVLAMSPDDITVEHAQNAGCYGHNGADDAALDAALLARAVPGRSVLLKWDREDEHAWEPYSPAMAIPLAARVENGRITYWSADIYSQSHMGRPRPFNSVSNLIAAWHRADPMPRAEARPAIGNHVGIHRNADPIYDFSSQRIIKHLVTDQRVRTSATRGLGAFGNVFAIESFMNELASDAGIDPIQFRIDHLSDPRAVEVIQTANRIADEYDMPRRDGWRNGRGMGFAQYKNRQCYACVVMFVSVNEETLEVNLRHAIIAADAGQIIDRDGISNQLEGGFIQAASWTLVEAVKFDEFATASTDWETYPILKFSQVPTVHVELIDRPDLPSLGAGEATQGPTPAAIANAVFDATHLRVRELPLTSDRLRSVALET